VYALQWDVLAQQFGTGFASRSFGTHFGDQFEVYRGNWVNFYAHERNSAQMSSLQVPDNSDLGICERRD
jgi:hypothetical protein